MNLVCLLLAWVLCYRALLVFNHFYVVWEETGIFKKSKEASETPNVLEKEWGDLGKQGWGWGSL